MVAENLTDKTGAQVRVEVDTDRGAVVIGLVDGDREAGRAFFVDADAGTPTRIFYHTEVDEEFGGRGLGGLLVRWSLDDARQNGITVVPVCKLFAKHLETHGDEYVAEGGSWRLPHPTDLETVESQARR